MIPRGLSAADIRRRNRSGILRLIHCHGALARNDLAAALGLTRASVTILSGEMLDEGLLEEAGASGPGGKAGRRKIFLRIRPEAGTLIGAGVEPDRLQVLTTDLAGRVLGVRDIPSRDFAGTDTRPGPGRSEKKRPGAVDRPGGAGPGSGVPPAEADPGNLPAGADPGNRLAGTVLRTAIELVGAASLSAAGVAGAGLGVTGRVDPETGTCLREPRIWNGPVPLAAPLEAALGVSVSVDNNVRALALGELLLTETRRKPPPGLLFVKYGPGVGGAWTAGGPPWAGAQNRAGEIGHTLVEAEGPVCPMCGRRGCLESLVSLSALRARARGDGRASKAGIQSLLRRLAREDPGELSLLAARFARALGNAIQLLDPSRIALYGLPFRNEDLLRQIASRVESTGRPCEIRRSGLDPALPALGGAALALDRFLEGGGEPGVTKLVTVGGR